MTKTRRMIESDIKLCDAVVEITDARCPQSSRNPILDELTGSKPRVILMNKADYADAQVTAEWKKYYESVGMSVLACDCRSGKGLKNFLPLLKRELSAQLQRRREKGMSGMKLRIMVTGIPNVGKSSFINRMANAKKTAVGDRPGVTRGKQWVDIDKEIELLDMPGILWHKFEDENVALKLAFTGAIKDEVMDTVTLATKLAEELLLKYPQPFTERFKLKEKENILSAISKVRGMLMSGGKPDIERAAVALIDEFRGGKIGRISLETPSELRSTF
ncbi:MAG: ribosome biogenesis GTPase YlqF [Oscillospiraceae bacterium]|nr:ribosome biogenesis GTPase YlqF [Oscillospiraceae bacterium]